MSPRALFVATRHGLGPDLPELQAQLGLVLPGSMAKVAFQMLVFADDLPRKDPRRERLRRIARNCAGWIERQVGPAPNGWFPRRVSPDGKVWRKSPDGGDDRFWQTSADGLFILQLQAALTARKLADYRSALHDRAAVFMRAGGIFAASTMTPMTRRKVSPTRSRSAPCWPPPGCSGMTRSRTLLMTGGLAGLELFKMREDRHGVATKGLLYMEKSWDTAYLWENAEAALAYSRRPRTRGSAKRRFTAPGNWTG